MPKLASQEESVGSLTREQVLLSVTQPSRFDNIYTRLALLPHFSVIASGTFQSMKEEEDSNPCHQIFAILFPRRK